MKGKVRLVVILCLLVVCCTLFTEKARAEDSGVHHYVVRGVVVQLPSKPGAEIFIRHEPIPEYVNEAGTVVGMHAMTMPFWLAESVSLGGVGVGDHVEFSLESRWSPKPVDLVTALKKVPPRAVE